MLCSFTNLPRACFIIREGLYYSGANDAVVFFNSWKTQLSSSDSSSITILTAEYLTFKSTQYKGIVKQHLWLWSPQHYH